MDNMIKICGMLIFIFAILGEISCASPIKALAATSSSTGWGFGPKNAIDSDPNSFFHSADNENNPWLEVTFAEANVNGVKLTPRTGYDKRLANIVVRAGKLTTPLDNPIVGKFDGPGVDGSGTVHYIEFDKPVTADRVIIQIEGKATMNIGEVEVIEAEAATLETIKALAATSSSTGWGFGPKNAIDSDPNTFFHSADNENNPWLEVTFAEGSVNGVKLTPRSGKESRMKNIVVRAGKLTTPLDNPIVGKFDGPGVDGSGTVHYIEFTKPVTADRVIIQIEGKGTMNVGEVEVIKAEAVTLETIKAIAATSSSTGWGFGPKNAIDSDPDTFFHSADNENNPWLEVTFAEASVNGVKLTPRSGKESRIKNIVVRAGKLTTPLDNPIVGKFDGPGVDGSGTVHYIEFTKPVTADRVIIQIEGKGTMNIGEVEVIKAGAAGAEVATTTTLAPLETIKAIAATSSSTGYGFGPGNLIDSKPDTFFHSEDNENNPWVQVTFAENNVNGVRLTPRAGFDRRLENIVVRAGKLTTPLDNPIVGRFAGPGVDGSGTVHYIEFDKPVIADRVVIQIEGKATMNMGEVEVIKAPAQTVVATSPPDTTPIASTTSPSTTSPPTTPLNTTSKPIQSTGTPTTEKVTLNITADYQELRAKHKTKLEEVMKVAIVAALGVSSSEVQNVTCTEGSIIVTFNLVTASVAGNDAAMIKVKDLGKLTVDGKVLNVKYKPVILLSQSKNTETQLNTVPIIIGAVAGVVVLVGIICAGLWWAKNKKKSAEISPEQ